MYFNNNIFCYKNNIWELSSDEIYLNFDNIIINFEIYNYLIENINKHIDKFNDMPFLNCTVSYIKKLIKKNNSIFDNLVDFTPYTNGKVHLSTGKLEPIVQDDYYTFTMGYEFNEERNEELINHYHQIYVDIFNDNAEEVEWFIAYSMTGVVKYWTDFLFNLGKAAAYGKSTITNMYKVVLPLYWTQINKDTFSTKHQANQKEISKFRKNIYFVMK